MASVSFGFQVTRWEHPKNEKWDEEWRNIVVIYARSIDLNGAIKSSQLSWHVHDSDMPLFDWIPLQPNCWDGHATSEKYVRLKGVLKWLSKNGDTTKGS